MLVLRVVSFFRVATLALMAATLVAGFFRPEFFPVLRKALFWVVPAWIVLLFAVQTLTTPNSSGTTLLETWINRLRGRKWTCGRCGRTYPYHVPLCGKCGALRPDVVDEAGPWTCEVCETRNEPEAAACSRCTVPRRDEAT